MDRTALLNHDRRRQRARPILRGFSLIELVLVMMIIVVMASMAIPRFGGTLARNRVEAAARRVAYDLGLARQQALVASAIYTMSFDVAASSYHLVGVTDPDHPTASYVVRLSDPPYEVQIVSAILGRDATITFNGYGLPDSGGSVILATGGYAMAVMVDADSGRISVTSDIAAAEAASLPPAEH